jgi:hypothetical protein
MEDKEGELTKHLEDKEYMRQLLEDHQRKEKRWRSIRNLLICICLVLAICFAMVFDEWTNEKELRNHYQLESHRLSNEAGHYKMLYDDCLNQEDYQ